LYAAGEPRLLEAAPPHYGLWDVLGHAMSLATLALAGLGAALVAWRRERAVVPLLAFVALYAAIVGRSHLVLNRYALPLLPAIAFLAAHALRAIRPTALALAIAGLAIVTQLAPTASYLRLLATEDTRVAAATWLTTHVPPDAKLFLPGGPLWSAYVAPDLLRPLQL